MSAYIVDPRTIDLLLTAASDQAVTEALRDAYPRGSWETEDPIENKSTLGRYLWSMNVRSVQYRYPSDQLDTLPGYAPSEWMSGTQYHPMPAYEYTVTRIGRYSGHSVTEMPAAHAARVVAAAHCYEYQSCELPEYQNSPAQRFVRDLVWTTASSDGWEYTTEEDPR